MQNSQGFSQGVFLSQGISHIFHSIFTGFHPIVVAAYVGNRITSKHFEDAGKQLCDAVPLLNDAKPPLWPEEVEFDYWVW